MDRKLTALKEKINDKFPEDKKIKLVVILGIIGMVLIGLSQIISTDNEKLTEDIVPLSLETDNYKKSIENELEIILRSIEGVGEVEVMLTIEGTTEYIYAEEYQIENEKSADTNSDSYQNKYVMVDKGNTNEPLIKKVIKPKINGVVVVCEGGGNVLISEKVYKAVSTVLNISSNRVCVVKG